MGAIFDCCEGAVARFNTQLLTLKAASHLPSPSHISYTMNVEPLESRSSPRRPAITMIEPLEDRVAPASLSFTDVDGDMVTVTTSGGLDVALDSIVSRVNEGLGEELRKINFALSGFTLTLDRKSV